jgi:hypothetical protein
MGDRGVRYHQDADVLGIGFLPYDRMHFSELYGLDTGSFPQGDRVQVIVEAEGNDGTVPTVAVIEHHCEEFDGAIDVWAGSHLCSDPRLCMIAAQEQVFVRACAYLLERRGFLSSEERKEIDERALARWETFPREVKPAPPFPRDAGRDSVHPERSSSPALTPALSQRERGFAPPEAGGGGTRLSILDLRDADTDLRIAMLSLAGLVNRAGSRLYCILDGADAGWVEYLSSTGRIPGGTESLTPEEALERFASSYRGTVIPPSPDELYCGIHAAIAFSAVRDLIVASPKVVKRFDLRVGTDLRGRWESMEEANTWIREYLYPRMNPEAAALISPDKIGLIDFLVARRILPFWITGPRDAVEPGANTVAEIAFANGILAGMPPNRPVYGFGHSGLYRGLGEAEGVEIVSRYGKHQVVTGRTANLSIHSVFPAVRLRQKRREMPEFDPGKAYVAVVMSDGDNLNYWRDRFPRLFDDPARGTFPMGWSIGPSGLDLEPAFFERIYERATENDCFVAAVSGYAYIYPEIYGSAYPDPEKILGGFLDLTRRKMEALDLRMVHIHHHGPYGDTSEETLRRYAAALPDDGAGSGLIVGYDRREYVNTLDDAAILVDGDTPVFRVMTQGKVSNVVAEIRAFVGDARPAFACAVTRPWRFKPAEFKKEFDALGPDFVLVTPEELATLYSSATGTGQ